MLLKLVLRGVSSIANYITIHEHPIKPSLLFSLSLTFTRPLSGLIQQMTNWWFFFFFSQKTGFDISCKLSPIETICMKCQILFSGKNKKKYISICHLLKFLPRVLSVNVFVAFKVSKSIYIVFSSGTIVKIIRTSLVRSYGVWIFRVNMVK